jgi:predicted Zn-dependent protease
MLRRRAGLGVLAVLAVLLVSCGGGHGRRGGRGEQGEGPGGRSQPLALTPKQELALGRKASNEVMQEARGRVLPEDDPSVRRVRAVLARLVKATEIEPLRREINLQVRGYTFVWKANVIRDKQVNAFCLPAGFIFVYTGLLRVTGDNDAYLATVMSHEMAHALAHHASERVARARRGGGGILSGLREKSYDRMQESEADHVGVFLMAFAGYDPQEAVAFWQRMRQASARGEPPEFLSDHPNHSTRIAQLTKWAPQAKAAKRAYDEGRIAPASRK